MIFNNNVLDTFFFNLAYYKLFFVLTLFLSLFVLLLFTSFLGSWIKSNFDFKGYFVFVLVLLLGPVLALIIILNCEAKNFSLSLFGDFYFGSYGFNFLSSSGDLFNEIPVFKGFWFDLIGGVDQLSVIFIFMVHVVAIMTISFSYLYFSPSLSSYRKAVRDLEVFKLSVFCVLAMSFFLDILFLTTNLVVMFILAELTLLPLSFLMLKDNTVFWRSGFERFSFFKNSFSPNSYLEEKFESKRPLAFYYLIFFTIVSGGLGLFGISLIYLIFGTTSIPVLSSLVLSKDFLNFISIAWIENNFIYLDNFNFFYVDWWLVVVSLFLIIFWISVKVPLAPVHIWLPKAHVEGSTESSMLLAGIILKITVYILIRLLAFPFFIPFFIDFKSFFLSIAVLTAVVGAFGALLTTDLKRIVAYSSVSHMGIIMSAGFFIVSSPLSLFPFIVLLLTHTIVSTAMFMMVGCIYKSRFSNFISRNKLVYGGLLYIFPSFFLFGIIIFANLNIPLTMGFMGELGTLIAVVQSGLTIGIFLCLAAFVLLLPMVGMLGQVLMGPIRTADFFLLKNKNNLNYFYLRSVFNKVVWSKSFLDFYSSQYLYFFSTVFVVIIFGFFPFLLANYLETFTLIESTWFDYILNILTFLN